MVYICVSGIKRLCAYMWICAEVCVTQFWPDWLISKQETNNEIISSIYVPERCETWHWLGCIIIARDTQLYTQPSYTLSKYAHKSRSLFVAGEWTEGWNKTQNQCHNQINVRFFFKKSRGCSLIPRPSPTIQFLLTYSHKTKGKGLLHWLMWMLLMSTQVHRGGRISPIAFDVHILCPEQ